MWEGDNLAVIGLPDEVAINLYVLCAFMVDRVDMDPPPSVGPPPRFVANRHLGLAVLRRSSPLMALLSAGSVGSGDGLVRSYASAVSKLVDIPSFNISLRFPVDINDELGFVFMETEMTKAAEEYKFAIVTKFFRVRPSIDVIRLNVVKKWGLVEILTISFMDDYHVLLQMKNERDFVHGWAREGRVMEGFSFRLF
ncbi:hypothetical protein ACLOJK_025917 [Asimina triloba]